MTNQNRFITDEIVGKAVRTYCEHPGNLERAFRAALEAVADDIRAGVGAVDEKALDKAAETVARYYVQQWGPIGQYAIVDGESSWSQPPIVNGKSEVELHLECKRMNARAVILAYERARGK